MNKKLLMSKINASKSEVTEAEEHLTKVLRTTRHGPRAEKTTMTEAVSEAITKLKAARADLDELGKLLADED